MKCKACGDSLHYGESRYCGECRIDYEDPTEFIERDDNEEQGPDEPDQ